MISTIHDLHTAYTTSAGIDLALNMVSERWWYEASKLGVTPEDVQLAVKWRIRQTSQQKGTWGLLLRHLIGSEEAICELLNQAAMARAELRQRTIEPGKASVLAATGRPTVMPDPGARPAKEVIIKGLDGLRKAVE